MSKGPEAIKICGCCNAAIDTGEDGDCCTNLQDGSFVCDECFEEHYTDVCALCGDYFPKFEITGDREVFIVGVSSLENTDIDSQKMPPGLYRVTRYPYFCSDYLSMSLYEDAFERIGNIFRSDPPCFNDFPMGKVCPDCVKKRMERACHIARTGVDLIDGYEWREMLERQLVAPRHQAFRCPACGQVQSADSLDRLGKLHLSTCEMCGTCGFSVLREKRVHKIEVRFNTGVVLPSFVPVTPEGAQRFMCGGKKPVCRFCGNDYLFPGAVWMSPYLCSVCEWKMRK
jgi:hypothetical protein